MSELVTAARPYARAAFDVARDHDELTQWSRMLAALSAVVADETVEQLVHNPGISTERIAGLLIDILEQNLAGGRGRNFVCLLSENRRLELAGHIAGLFEQYRADAEQRVQAEIVSAFALDEAQLEPLRRALRRRMGREVVITCRVDEALLGGAVVRVGDLVIDGSLSARVKKLSDDLAQ